MLADVSVHLRWRTRGIIAESGAKQSSVEQVAEQNRGRRTILRAEAIDARDGKEGGDAMALEAARARGLIKAFRCPTVRNPARRP